MDKKAVKKYQMDMLEYFDNVYPEIGKEIDESKVLSDELGEKSFRLQMNSRIVQPQNKAEIA